MVTVDINTFTVKQVFNLNKITNANKHLGWCRGIKVLDQNKVIVGFTRLRPSNNPEANNQSFWEISEGVSPTRIACYDLSKGELLWEHSLEQYGLNAVFSIHGEDE